MHKGLIALTALCLTAATASASWAEKNPLRVSQGEQVSMDIAAFRGGPQALPRAIRAVEAATGGEVVEARLTSSHGTPGFGFVVLRNGEVSFLRAGTDGSGATVITDADLPAWMLSWRQRRELRAASHARASLTDAISVAEQSAHGAPAVAAGISRTAASSLNSVKAYNVLLAEDGRPVRIAVDARTGQVIADPGALDWP